MVGIDDELGPVFGPGASVTFQVWVDGIMKYESPVMLYGMAAVPVLVDVTGGVTLNLVVTTGPNNNYEKDHADWADAKLTCTGTPPLAP